MTLTVQYFWDLIDQERTNLTELCHKWTTVLDTTTDLSEDVQGQIRTVTGQANLLMDQRFKQFSGLITNCEQKLGEKETTCEDLQGFWDMIYFQVEDVHTKFSKLEKLKENDWKPEEATEQRKKLPKTRPTVSEQKPTSSAKERADAARQRLKEAKARAAKLNEVSSDCGSSVKNKENVKVFEAPGFFVVNSPVKSTKIIDMKKNSESSPKKTVRTPVKDLSPICRVTRSAKRALQQQNVVL